MLYMIHKGSYTTALTRLARAAPGPSRTSATLGASWRLNAQSCPGTPPARPQRRVVPRRSPTPRNGGFVRRFLRGTALPARQVASGARPHRGPARAMRFRAPKWRLEGSGSRWDATGRGVGPAPGAPCLAFALRQSLRANGWGVVELAGMALPAPCFMLAHAVLQPANPVPRDAARDAVFIDAVRDEFPNVTTHQVLPPEALITAPHLVLASSSAQLAVSSAQLDFEVRFYGDYLADVERGLEYVERKLLSIVRAMNAVGSPPAVIGLIGTLHFSFKDRGGLGPAEHILRTHLRGDVPPETLQDAMTRIAVKVRDTYFVTMSLSNYESRVLERPFMPGLGPVRVRPWEGRIEDQGLELTLDINNGLEARTRKEDPLVTEDGVHAVTQLLREVATTTGPVFAESAEISIEALATSSEAASSEG